MELFDPPAVSSGRLLARLRDLIDPGRDARHHADLEEIEDLFAHAHRSVRDASEAHAQHAARLRTIALHLDMDIASMARRVAWCNEVLEEMRRKLVQRRPDPEGGSRQLLLHLGKCLRSFRMRLQPLQEVLTDMQDLRSMAQDCLMRRGAVLGVPQTGLPACQQRWSLAVSRLGAPDLDASDRHAQAVIETTEQLRLLLAQETRSFLQARLSEEALAEALTQLDARLTSVLHAAEWQETPISPTSLFAAASQPAALAKACPGRSHNNDADDEPEIPAARQPRRIGIADAMAVARRNNRAGPKFASWAALHDLLMQAAVRGKGQTPPGPIAREDWEHVSPLNKRPRLREQINCQWEHMQD